MLLPVCFQKKSRSQLPRLSVHCPEQTDLKNQTQLSGMISEAELPLSVCPERKRNGLRKAHFNTGNGFSALFCVQNQ